MELRVAIVDDLESDRSRLTRDVRAFFSGRQGLDNLSMTEFTSAESLLNNFEADTYDLALLDICMDGMNGIDLARWLRAKDPRILIAFLTTSREYAFDAFPVHPFDYLVKPYETSRLYSVLEEVMRVMAIEEPMVEIRVPRGTSEIPIRKIAAIESRGHSVELHLTDGQTVRSIMRFAEVERLLGSDQRFLTCNRGVMVNMDQVLTLEEGALKMRDGTVYPLRVRDRASLKARFSQYMISRVDEGRRA